MTRPLKLVVPQPESDEQVALDPGALDLRVSSARTGGWVTVVCCIPALVYVLTGTRDPSVIAAWGVALVAGVVAYFLPWRRIVRSRWREWFFVTWTLLICS